MDNIWEDPIVKETRELREEYAKQFNHNPDAIFEDILKRQSQSGRELFSREPRKAQWKPGLFERTAGAWQGEPLERASQGESEPGLFNAPRLG